MSVFFNVEDIDFSLKDEAKVIDWISKVVSEHDSLVGEISYIFCSDEYLLNINREYLQHDYYTDVITFDYTEDNIISGDIFLSIDRVKDNAALYAKDFDEELKRVIIHGILHLLNFKDKTEDESKLMREKEDECLKVF